MRLLITQINKICQERKHSSHEREASFHSLLSENINAQTST